MVEVGDKVVCVDAAGYDCLTAGKVYTVDRLYKLDIWVIDDEGDLASFPFRRFKPHTETEAEKRGAKFGVMGVSKITGRKVRFIADDGKKSIHGEPLWVFLNEERQSIMRLRPSDVRFDHEPEYVAWVDAPEELKYDASRVYYDGEPVKWIAKPEGAFTDVVVVQENGIMRFSTHNLTVKL